MNDLIAGYANYASTEAILQERQLAAREPETGLFTLTITISLTITVTISL
ncbi:hypothetical protein GT755_21505 [Herbidospora sp. NEAU-GS84]|uniref:Uncharacterized protein n=1 Tax=Herbidospora solisilvae TaxID=2696284 RepID=A0A7C9J5D0_9ACTN|nr:MULTISPECIES: hypothetical protein [Herbidospora]NAS24260.1 hypothetical protein [Herbidospora solisilvae]GLX98306.1 hypothetical protein Hesp01_62560 [Herbidospora sp. NBRC 101105]